MVTTFADLVNGVIKETLRPDMGFASLGGDGRIPQAVLSSILKMHGMEFFFKDLQTAQVKFDAAAYLQTLDTRALPYYRSISYIRKNNPSLATYQQNPTILPPIFAVGGLGDQEWSWQQTNKIDILDSPTDIFDDYEMEKYDVAYQVGDTMMIKSSTALLWGLIGWYRWPYLGVEADNHIGYKDWLADEFPYAIIYDAASGVLQKIGMTDAARKYDAVNPGGIQVGLVASHVTNLRMANITPRGY